MDSQRVNPANTPDRQLLPKIDKGTKKLNINKTNNTITYWSMELNSEFSKGEILMANKHSKCVGYH